MACTRPRLAQLSYARRPSSRVGCAAGDAGRWAAYLLNTISKELNTNSESKIGSDLPLQF